MASNRVLGGFGRDPVAEERMKGTFMKLNTNRRRHLFVNGLSDQRVNELRPLTASLAEQACLEQVVQQVSGQRSLDASNLGGDRRTEPGSEHAGGPHVAPLRLPDAQEARE
jgi:hypothetical protein